MAENKAFIHPKTGNLVTPKGRLLWNALFQRRKAKGGKEGKFEFNLLIPKTANIDAMKTAALDAGKDKFSKAFKDAAGKWPSGVKSPFKKTAENDKLAELAEDFPLYIAARSNDAPGVVNALAQPAQPEDVYHGRWAKGTIQAFGYETDGNKGVTFGLINVQILDDDDELVIGGGRVSAESEFEAVDGVSGDDSKSSDDVFA